MHIDVWERVIVSAHFKTAIFGDSSYCYYIKF